MGDKGVSGAVVVICMTAADEIVVDPQVNSILCHPTMPIIVIGSEDGYLRFHDTCKYSWVAHVEANIS